MLNNPVQKMKLNFFLSATIVLLSSSLVLKLEVNGVRFTKQNNSYSNIDNQQKESKDHSNSQSKEEKKVKVIDALSPGFYLSEEFLFKDTLVFKLEKDFNSPRGEVKVSPEGTVISWGSPGPAFTVRDGAGRLLKKVFVRDVTHVQREHLKHEFQFKYNFITASGHEFHICVPIDWFARQEENLDALLDAFRTVINNERSSSGDENTDGLQRYYLYDVDYESVNYNRMFLRASEGLKNKGPLCERI